LSLNLGCPLVLPKYKGSRAGLKPDQLVQDILSRLLAQPQLLFKLNLKCNLEASGSSLKLGSHRVAARTLTANGLLDVPLLAVQSRKTLANVFNVKLETRLLALRRLKTRRLSTNLYKGPIRLPALNTGRRPVQRVEYQIATRKLTVSPANL
jgi:hypothetical protein